MKSWENESRQETHRLDLRLDLVDGLVEPVHVDGPGVDLPHRDDDLVDDIGVRVEEVRGRFVVKGRSGGVRVL